MFFTSVFYGQKENIGLLYVIAILVIHQKRGIIPELPCGRIYSERLDGTAVAKNYYRIRQVKHVVAVHIL
jgi:hypothetical protein